MNAETPNTRSRRKRALEGSSSQEDGGGGLVKWVDDQRLCRAFMQVASEDEVQPPTPTQKPRPISSAFLSPASSSLTLRHPQLSAAHPSSSRPRKRPCRQHRSLPSQLATPKQDTRDRASGSSSAPPPDRKRSSLDKLLEEAMGILVLTPEGLAAGGRRNVEESSSTLSSSTSEGSVVSRQRAPPNRLHAPVVDDASSSLRPSTDAIAVAPTKSPLASDRALMKQPSLTRANIPKPSSSSFAQASRTPLSPCKPGPPPRIGLRSSQSHPPKSSFPRKPPSPSKPALPSPSSRIAGPAARPFKPPLLSRQPTRSSPRRLSAQQQQQQRQQTPLRTPIRSLPASMAGHIPSDGTDGGGGTGDESFDSFDGMLAEGGQEVEELWRTVDGSQ